MLQVKSQFHLENSNRKRKWIESWLDVSDCSISVVTPSANLGGFGLLLQIEQLRSELAATIIPFFRIFKEKCLINKKIRHKTHSVTFPCLTSSHPSATAVSFTFSAVSTAAILMFQMRNNWKTKENKATVLTGASEVDLSVISGWSGSELLDEGDHLANQLLPQPLTGLPRERLQKGIFRLWTWPILWKQ